MFLSDLFTKTMQNLPFIASLFSLLHTADCAQPDTHIEIRKAQAALLHRSLNAVSTNIVCGNGNCSEVCNWKGIECTHGVVTTLFLDTLDQTEDASIFMEWLPPTLEFVHLISTRLASKKSLSYLPRELKYLYLGFCHGTRADIDCARLPRKMEELILLESTISKEIRLDSLPSTMHYIYIEQLPEFTKSIVVNYDTLPACMRETWVTSFYKGSAMKPKVKTIGTPGEVQLQTTYDERYPKRGSTYLWSFEEWIS